MKEYWASLASLLGVLAFCQSLADVIFPAQLRYVVVKFFHKVFNFINTNCYYDITEIDGVNTNELYNAVQLYLSSQVSTVTGARLSLARALNSSSITFGLTNNDSVTDVYDGVTVVWEHVVAARQSAGFSWRPLPEEKRGFVLKINKRDKNRVLCPYLEHITERSIEIRRESRERNLYTNSKGGSIDSRGNPWESVPFKHPSTFDTLAMDPVMKTRVMEDLMDFVNGGGFYQKTGRAWKRGYLLYGPPGTGKSSMIAAMANYLGYDIYDLELTEVQNNSELRKLLMKTSSKSIIVIEDIDCSLNLTNRNSKNTKPRHELEFRVGSSVFDETSCNSNWITLSGLLNFTDGLWSCCGSERIFVFTTNHIEKLDPALLRSGRMDMHVFMSYCSFPGLKILLKNYLGFEEDELNGVVLDGFEEVIDKAEITPADVSEILIKNRRNREIGLSELLKTLKVKARLNLSSRERKSIEEDEEEHEKRALDSPNRGDIGFDEMNCEKEDEKE